MISIAVLTRQARAHAADCLNSLLFSIKALKWEDKAEFLFIDDCSDESIGMIDLFRTARANTSADVRIFRFRKHQHYAYGMAFMLSIARGEQVLFFSHDMVITPICLRVLFDPVFTNDPGIGIVRCASPHMDCTPQLQLAPPVPLDHYNRIVAFSEFAMKYHGGNSVEPPVLIGDSMLIKRPVIDRIGVFDTRFFGLMGDIDYGLRAQRAGFRHIVAMGAWVKHEGSVASTHILAAGGADPGAAIHETWKAFREKWDPSLPEDPVTVTGERMAQLRFENRLTASEYQPPIAIDPEIVETF